MNMSEKYGVCPSLWLDGLASSKILLERVRRYFSAMAAAYRGVELSVSNARDLETIAAMARANGLELAAAAYQGRLRGRAYAAEERRIACHAELVRKFGGNILVYQESPGHAGAAPLTFTGGDLHAYAGRITDMAEFVRGKFELSLVYRYAMEYAGPTANFYLETGDAVGVLLDECLLAGADTDDIVHALGARIRLVHAGSRSGLKNDRIAAFLKNGGYAGWVMKEHAVDLTSDVFFPPDSPGLFFSPPPPGQKRHAVARRNASARKARRQTVARYSPGLAYKKKFFIFPMACE